MPRQDTLFDVDDSSAGNLAFQDFGTGSIQPDVPLGRISPNGASSSSPSPHARAGQDLYSAEQRLGSSIDGATKSGGVLNLDFYSSWFDVNTAKVLERCYKTLIPKEDYVGEVLEGAPDLYGPFWVPTTLVFSLFLTSSLYTSIAAYLDDAEYSYDFTRLGAATSVVYTYYLGVPLLVWAALKYWAGASDRSPVEIVSLYGYSSTVWILVAWLSLIPVSFVSGAFALVGTLLSLLFLVRNLYPILATAPNVSARILIVVVAVLHLVYAVAVWWGFVRGGRGALVDRDLKDVAGEIGSGLGQIGSDVGEEVLRRWWS
ncbi:hypothetical protein JCM8208_000021 [Rhodotorula glutinis]